MAGLAPAEDELYGAWAEPVTHPCRWNADGRYAVDDEGRLVASPEDSWSFVFTDSTLGTESGPTSGVCEEGDPWTWEVQLLDGGVLLGRITEDGCYCILGERVLFRVSPSVGVSAMMRPMCLRRSSRRHISIAIRCACQCTPKHTEKPLWVPGT